MTDRLRIITWNCNMAFRKKVECILKYEPDILVIPECEHPDKLILREDVPKPNSFLWFGTNHHKGLGILSYGNFKCKVLRSHKPELRWIIPLAVTNGIHKLTIYAVWAYNPLDPDGCYITQVWKALQFYNRTITKKGTLLVGDFNSNTIWDKPKREGNHSTVVARLEKKGIHSTYHHHFKQTQGKEQHPTLYMYRHKDKAYHIDYCFASDDLIQKLNSVEVGDYEYWTRFSDHVPVIVTFNLD